METWKIVKDYDGIYMVSNLGNIKSLKRNIYRKDGRLHYIQPEKILKPSKLPIGYYYVSLHKNGLTKLKTIHSLVADAFIPNPLNKRTVNHKDGDKLNNNVNNLEWATDSENHIHALENGLKLRFGLIAIDINTGNKIIYQSVSDAVKLGFKQQMISNACLNKKIYNGYLWEYITRIKDQNQNK